MPFEIEIYEAEKHKSCRKNRSRTPAHVLTLLILKSSVLWLSLSRVGLRILYLITSQDWGHGCKSFKVNKRHCSFCKNRCYMLLHISIRLFWKNDFMIKGEDDFALKTTLIYWIWGVLKITWLHFSLIVDNCSLLYNSLHPCVNKSVTNST